MRHCLAWDPWRVLLRIVARKLKLQSLTALRTISTLLHFSHLQNAKSIPFCIQQFGNLSFIPWRTWQNYYDSWFAEFQIALKDCGNTSSSSTILDKVLSLNALCFHLGCTDRDVWIGSTRLGVCFVRARPSKSTAAVSHISHSCSSRHWNWPRW